MIKEVYDSPVGRLLLVADRGHLKMVDWISSPKHTGNLERLSETSEESAPEDRQLIEKVILSLDEYFGGKRKYFGLSLSAVSTEFERKVWEALMTIDYGRTVTYGELAEVIGRPKAVRAVANAVARNPISIIVPCHRVIGARNNLGGYAGGKDAKNYLLLLETGYL